MVGHAYRRQHGVAGRTDGRNATVEPGGGGLHRVGRIDHGAAHAMAGKRDAQGQADKATAQYDDVEALHGGGSRRLRGDWEGHPIPVRPELVEGFYFLPSTTLEKKSKGLRQAQPERGDVVSSFTASAQIGRASCRERVCQYV